MLFNDINKKENEDLVKYFRNLKVSCKAFRNKEFT